MNLKDIYKKNTKKPIISYEIFPPKDDINNQKLENLFLELKILKKYNPALISVTYGAGGSNRNESIQIIKRIKNETAITPMHHFTCVSTDKANIKSYLNEIESLGIKNILAKYHGEDPVMIKLPPIDGYSTRIMTSSIFWVKTSNDLINNLKQVFPNKLDIKIDSLDRPLSV